VAIGCAGIEPIADWRGRADRGGRELEATAIAIADQIAAAADLARDKVAGLPVVLARGLGLRIGADGPGAAALIRPPGGDLFR
jgi:coenzyme F420-0:L-glutamate ligase/coenzyme F420-1:gamma-L-glutamate ligase